MKVSYSRPAQALAAGIVLWGLLLFALWLHRAHLSAPTYDWFQDSAPWDVAGRIVPVDEAPTSAWEKILATEWYQKLLMGVMVVVAGVVVFLRFAGNFTLLFVLLVGLRWWSVGMLGVTLVLALYGIRGITISETIVLSLYGILGAITCSDIFRPFIAAKDP